MSSEEYLKFLAMLKGEEGIVNYDPSGHPRYAMPNVLNVDPCSYLGQPGRPGAGAYPSGYNPDDFIECAFCGRRNLPEREFCAGCGAPLTERRYASSGMACYTEYHEELTEEEEQRKSLQEAERQRQEEILNKWEIWAEERKRRSLLEQARVDAIKSAIAENLAALLVAIVTVWCVYVLYQAALQTEAISWQLPGGLLGWIIKGAAVFLVYLVAKKVIP